MKKEKPIIESQEEIYEGFFNLRVEYLKREEKAMTYTVLDMKADGVTILAKKKDQYLILKEYRHPLREYIYGPPGGRIEKGEDLALSAKREFFEETGYEIHQIQYMGAHYPMPSVCDHKIHLFYAPEIGEKKKPHRDPFEMMEVHFFSEQEIFEKVKNKEKVDGNLMVLFFYKNFLSK